MKRLISTILIAICTVCAFAQSINISFTGKTIHGRHVVMDSIVICNITQGWTATLVAPDTSCSFDLTAIKINNAMQAELSQNVPNPFHGTTEVSLSLPKPDKVGLQVHDIGGRLFADYNGNLPDGEHRFEISLATPQSYLLSATTSSGTSSVKMVNLGSGGGNKISYLGQTEGKSLRDGDYDIVFGDDLECTGYTTYLGRVYDSNTIIVSTNIYSDIEQVLTFNLKSSSFDEIIACDSYTWVDGITYTESNHTATYTYTNSMDCDSVVTLNLTINHSNTGIDVHTAANSYTWIDGNTYTESNNTATYTLQNIDGCDSIVTLNLTIITPCNCGTAIDYDGNVYNTVLIGEQCWMASNLKTTHFADGRPIPITTTESSFNTAFRYRPNNSISSVSTHGYLYNWAATLNESSGSNTNPSQVQGICPAGWHLPSNEEWMQLIRYVQSHNEYLCEGGIHDYAKALASTTGWSSSVYNCAVGNDPSTNNLTGFCAMPAGCYSGYYNSFSDITGFWSATAYEYNNSRWNAFKLHYNTSMLASISLEKNYAYSVRCVRNVRDTTNPCTTTHGIDTHIGCDSLVWIDGNIYYDDNDEAEFTVVTPDGCDSVVRLNFTTHPVEYELNVSSCVSPYAWDGYNYYASGSYTRTYTVDNGCDSIVRLNLTLNPIEYEFDVESCSYYQWDGQWYAYTGDYTRTYTAANGCDSVVTMHYTHLADDVTDTIYACDSYTWIDGVTYTLDDIGTRPYINALYIGTNSYGCDSLVVMYLFLQANKTIDTHRACDSYTWIDGNTYTESNNTATVTYTNQYGCDSIVQLNLTIEHPDNTIHEVTVEKCSYYQMSNGEYFTESGDYQRTLQSSCGCDSIVLLHLTITGENGMEGTFYDNRDGITYRTMQYGCQTWMAEDLRTSYLPNGTLIVDSIIHCPGDIGLLTYNNYYNTFYANSNNGFCPQGWHLPSSSEWLELANYLTIHSEYTCNETSIVKSIVSNIGWSISNVECSPGHNQSENNLSGLGLNPDGMQWLGSMYKDGLHDREDYVYLVGTNAFYINANSTVVNISNNSTDINFQDLGCTYGARIRCVRDN